MTKTLLGMLSMSGLVLAPVSNVLAEEHKMATEVKEVVAKAVDTKVSAATDMVKAAENATGKATGAEKKGEEEPECE